MFARIVGIAAVALACSAGLSQADEKVRVGTPESTSFSFSIPDVGNATGIFKKYGLDVERIDFAGGAKMHQAMDAGALDVISGTGSDILFLTKAALSLIVNADDASIKKIEDLKGKTIAVSTTGSFTSWIAKTILGQHGIKPDEFKFAYLGSMTGIVAGLLTKNVDASIGPAARSLQLEGEGRVRILANAGKEITNFIANIVYASDTMMEQHPETLKKFLAGYFETIRYMKAHKAETVKITQAATKLPDDIAAKGYDLEMPTFFTDGHFDRKKLAAVQQSLVDLKLIDHAFPDDQIITEKFLQ
jgi:NitT/TauT family transport system substrate-binding protein